METATTFNPAQYNYHGVVVVDANGTGHAQACPLAATAIADRGPEAVRMFTDGGFDLFCENFCMDEVLPKASFPKVEGTNMDAPAGGNAGPSAPVETGPDRWEGKTLADVEEWLIELGRKVDQHEVTPALAKLATEWAKSYEGTFSFMLDMREAAQTRRSGLSTGQAKGTLNCLRAELNRKPKVQKGSGSEELDLSELPAGMYAVPNGDTRLKVSVRKPGANSKWNGWTFVSDGAEYGSQRNYGKQAPGSIYVGEIQEALKAILADPMEASKAYGKLVGKCGRCGRLLEDEESIKNGIGPVCATKF